MLLGEGGEEVEGEGEVLEVEVDEIELQENDFIEYGGIFVVRCILFQDYENYMFIN